MNKYIAHVEGCHDPNHWIATNNDPNFSNDKFKKFIDVICYLELNGYTLVKADQFMVHITIDDKQTLTIMRAFIYEKIIN